jgi:hypothetical protein
VRVSSPWESTADLADQIILYNPDKSRKVVTEMILAIIRLDGGIQSTGLALVDGMPIISNRMSK